MSQGDGQPQSEYQEFDANTRYRLLFLTTGLLYPVWGLVIPFLNGHTPAPLWPRMGIGALFFVLGLLSLTGRLAQATLARAFLVSAILITGHESYLLFRNHHFALNLAGLVIVIFGVSICVEGRRQLAAYHVSVAAILACMLAAGPRVELVLTAALTATVMVMTYVATYDRYRLWTELGRVNRRLEERQRALEAAQAMARLGDFTLDPVTGQGAWSPAALQVLGLPPGASNRASDWHALVSDETRTHVMGEWNRTVAEAVPLDLEVPIRRADGAEAWVHARATPRPGPDGRVVEVFGTIQDVTERHERDRLIESQRLKIFQSERMSVLGEMAAGIAHEINTPLMVIQAASAQIVALRASDRPDEARVVALTGKIVKTVDRIASTIQGLRTYARDAEQDPMAPVAVHRLVADALELTTAAIANKGISLEVPEIDPELTVSCRGAQIVQVLLNLLNNAVDAVSATPGPVIRVTVGEVEGRIAMAVEDNGPGIPMQLRAKVMQPFFTTKPPGLGSGLGLSISQGIAVAHGGELRLSGGPGAMRVALILPRAAAAATAA